MFSVVFGLQPSMNGREKLATTARGSGTRIAVALRDMYLLLVHSFSQSNSLLRIDLPPTVRTSLVPMLLGARSYVRTSTRTVETQRPHPFVS